MNVVRHQEGGEGRNVASDPRFAFQGLPKIERSEQWGDLLASKGFSQVAARAGLARCAPEAAHQVACIFLKHLWQERGLLRYESRLGNESKEESKQLAGRIMSEVIREFSERDIAEYVQGRRTIAPHTCAAEELVVRNIVLPVLTGKNAIHAGEKQGLSLEVGNTPKGGGSTDFTLQDLSLQYEPKFYKQWCAWIEDTIAQGDDAAWVMSARAGIARKYLEFCAQEFLKTVRVRVPASEVVRAVERMVLHESGQTLDRFLDPLRDGDRDRRYHTYKMALSQHFYPWLREQRLTTYDPTADSLFMPVDAPVGAWWEQFFQTLAGKIEKSGGSANDEPFSREVAVRAARHARGYIQFHMRRLQEEQGVSGAATVTREMLERALGTEPRTAIRDFLRERHAGSDHHYKIGWADLNLHFMPILRNAGTTTYDGLSEFFIPPDIEPVHSLARWWGGYVAEAVWERREIPQRTGALWGRLVVQFLDSLWHSDEAQAIALACGKDDPGILFEETVKLLLEDDGASRAWKYAEQVRKEADSVRTGSSAYRLLKVDFFGAAGKLGLVNAPDFEWLEFALGSEPLKLGVYVHWMAKCFQDRVDKSITSSQAGHRLRAVREFLKHVIERRALSADGRESLIQQELFESFDVHRKLFEESGRIPGAVDLKANVKPALNAFKQWFLEEGAYQASTVVLPRAVREAWELTTEQHEKGTGTGVEQKLQPSAAAAEVAVQAVRVETIQQGDTPLQRTSRELAQRLAAELGLDDETVQSLHRRQIVMESDSHGVVLYGEQAGEFLARLIPPPLAAELSRYLAARHLQVSMTGTETPRLWVHEQLS